MQITLEPIKTYKTRENAIKAVEKAELHDLEWKGQRVRWMILTHSDGRFFPVFLGEPAVQCGIHFKFNVLG